MDGIKGILSKRLKAAPNKKLHSPAHLLADEITTTFGERKRFAMYLGVINRVGVEKARGIYRRLIQEKGALNHGKLFMFLCRKEPKAPLEEPPKALPEEPPKAPPEEPPKAPVQETPQAPHPSGQDGQNGGNLA